MNVKADLRPIVSITALLLILAGCSQLAGAGATVVPTAAPSASAPSTAADQTFGAPHSPPPASTSPMASAASSATPLTLTDEERASQHLDLLPIPPDAPPPQIDRSKAIDLASAALATIGFSGEPGLVEHGMAYVAPDAPRQSAWLVMIPVEGVPYQGGPPCPSACAGTLIVTYSAGALISDQTGATLGLFDSGHLVTPSPQALHAELAAGKRQGRDLHSI